MPARRDGGGTRVLPPRRPRQPAHAPSPTRSATSPTGPQVYTPDELSEIEDFLDDLHDVTERQGVPAGATTSEFAPGQYEINLHHVDDPLLACDHAVMLKRAIKAVARKHGLKVLDEAVATVDEGRGYAEINRTDRRRVVTVSADVLDA